MPTIIDMGDYHVEFLTIPLTAQNAADRYFSASLPLEKAGRYVGAAVISTSVGGNNDNSQAIGGIEVREGDGTALNYGDPITNISIRLVKQVGTSGPLVVTFNVLIFLRK